MPDLAQLLVEQMLDHDKGQMVRLVDILLNDSCCFVTLDTAKLDLAAALMSCPAWQAHMEAVEKAKEALEGVRDWWLTDEHGKWPQGDLWNPNMLRAAKLTRAALRLLNGDEKEEGPNE